MAIVARGWNAADPELKSCDETMGIVPMDTQTGIRALYQGMLSGSDQVMVLVEDSKDSIGIFKTNRYGNNKNRFYQWRDRPSTGQTA